MMKKNDIVATPNQRWTSEGPPANPHASRVVIASQIVTHNGVAVGSFWIISKYLARASVGRTHRQFCRKSTADIMTADIIGRVNAP